MNDKRKDELRAIVEELGLYWTLGQLAVVIREIGKKRGGDSVRMARDIAAKIERIKES